jgi:hypothetical protein
VNCRHVSIAAGCHGVHPSIHLFGTATRRGGTRTSSPFFELLTETMSAPGTNNDNVTKNSIRAASGETHIVKQEYVKPDTLIVGEGGKVLRL